MIVLGLRLHRELSNWLLTNRRIRRGGGEGGDM